MSQPTTTYMLDVDGIRVRVTRKRVRNVNFRIGPDGEALMSVPWHVSRARAEQIARDHRDWFCSHLRRAEERRGEVPVAWESGETIMVWGERTTLRVTEAAGAPGCTAGDGVLALVVPPGTTAAGRAALVERWRAEQMREALAGLLPACEERVGKRASSVTLRRMKSRWGSCTPKTARIRLNTALAACPRACLEMVLVHELCHLWEASHGPRFHALMDLHCPSWRVSQQWLDEHAPQGL